MHYCFLLRCTIILCTGTASTWSVQCIWVSETRGPVFKTWRSSVWIISGSDFGYLRVGWRSSVWMNIARRFGYPRVGYLRFGWISSVRMNIFCRFGWISSVRSDNILWRAKYQISKIRYFFYMIRNLFLQILQIIFCNFWFTYRNAVLESIVESKTSDH